MQEQKPGRFKHRYLITLLKIQITEKISSCGFRYKSSKIKSYVSYIYAFNCPIEIKKKK